MDVIRLEKTLKARKKAKKAGKTWMRSTFSYLEGGLTSTDAVVQSLVGYSQASIQYDQTLSEYNLALIRLWISTGLDPLSLLSSNAYSVH